MAERRANVRRIAALCGPKATGQECRRGQNVALAFLLGPIPPKNTGDFKGDEKFVPGLRLSANNDN
jgi:hypothetical protein